MDIQLAYETSHEDSEHIISPKDILSPYIDTYIDNYRYTYIYIYIFNIYIYNIIYIYTYIYIDIDILNIALAFCIALTSPSSFLS